MRQERAVLANRYAFEYLMHVNASARIFKCALKALFLLGWTGVQSEEWDLELEWVVPVEVSIERK